MWFERTGSKKIKNPDTETNKQVTTQDGFLLGSSGVYTGISLSVFQRSSLPPSAELSSP
jgi:hypothetical protein